MKQQDVFKKVGTILKELNEQYEYLSDDPEQLNELELELFAANANFLKDHAEILRKLNARPKVPAALPPAPPAEPKPVLELIAPPAEPKPEKKPEPEVKPAATEEKFFEPVVQRLPPVAEEVQEEEDGVASADNDAEESKTIRHELIIDEADLWDDEDEEPFDNEEVIEAEPEAEPEPFEVIAEEEITEPEPVEFTEPVFEFPAEEPAAVETEPINTIPAEPVKPEPAAVETEPVKSFAAPEVVAAQPEEKKEESARTINQRMSDQFSEKKNPALQPITDLKAAINLNDKLVYIKDLFNNYSLAYSEAIEILNRFNSFEEAERFLNTNYVTKNNWQDKKATADKFYDLLKRRYA